MAGGWSSITTEKTGRYYGAGILEGGDVEEFAEHVFGMVWYLAGRLGTQEAVEGPELREVALRWIGTAEENWREGLALGGRSDGMGDEEDL